MIEYVLVIVMCTSQVCGFQYHLWDRNWERDNIEFCSIVLQDNVFVQLLCSIQYRVVKQNADDAFYELQKPKEQIQAYVFDGMLG